MGKSFPQCSARLVIVFDATSYVSSAVLALPAFANLMSQRVTMLLARCARPYLILVDRPDTACSLLSSLAITYLFVAPCADLKVLQW